MDWAKKATDTYINDKKYNIVLGTGCSGNKSMTIHGWHRIGRKTLVNSFQTQMRRDQQRKWGIVFEGSLKTDKEAHNNNKSPFEIVDIGDFLPHKVKTDMCRADGTSFMIKRLDVNTVDVDTMLRTKIANMYSGLQWRGSHVRVCMKKWKNKGWREVKYHNSCVLPIHFLF